MALTGNDRPTRTIAVITWGAGSMFDELKTGMALCLQTHPGFSIFHFNFFNMDGSRFTSILFSNKFDGIISCVSRQDFLEEIKRYRDERSKDIDIPFVDLSGQLEDDPDVISADQDPWKIGALVAGRFLQRGFTNFAQLSFNDRTFIKHMEKAFSETVEKAGFKCNTFIFDHAHCDESRNRYHRWLASLAQHTALFCPGDWFARDTIYCCKKINRAVPDDIAIMGVGNDLPLCLGSAVSLSSVDPDFRGLGYAAMRIMAHVIEHPVKPKKRPVFRVPPLGIVERESTAIYPVDPPWLANALSLLDAKLDQPLSPADLATAAGVSQTTLQETFHRTFGTSAGKYILSVKMREAERLVNEGYLSVKEIAARTGFSSQSYFCRTYTGYYGRPPSQGRSAR